jgi:hypothetical protein
MFMNIKCKRFIFILWWVDKNVAYASGFAQNYVMSESIHVSPRLQLNIYVVVEKSYHLCSGIEWKHDLLKKDGYQLCNIGVYFLVDEITSKEVIQSVCPGFFYYYFS